MQEYLEPTRFLDHDAPQVQELAARAVGEATDPRERAARLFYAVRDGFRYDPYTLSLDPEHYRASVIARTTSAFCIPKAILLAAAGRAAGLPTRLGFADVRNHLASERLRQLMGTDVFAFHGFAEIHLDGRWLKATPAFNRQLCERFGVLPLEFDGTADALFQPFDSQGRRHMEYIREHGTFADFPYDEMVRVFRATYPGMSEADLAAMNDDGVFTA